MNNVLKRQFVENDLCSSKHFTYLLCGCQTQFGQLNSLKHKKITVYSL